jgi:hypothetical protein
MKNMFDLILDDLRDPMKQLKACEMNVKKPQNEVRLSLKPTPRSKGDRTKVKHKKGEHLQKQNKLASLGVEASMRMNILDMPSKVA